MGTGDIGARFAGEEERREISGGREAARVDFRRRGFDEDVRSRTASEALGRERIDFAQGQSDIATGVGVAGLGVDVLGGFLDIKEGDRRAAHIDQLREEALRAGDMEAVGRLDFLKIIESHKG
jgi:hypothetical protein